MAGRGNPLHSSADRRLWLKSVIIPSLVILLLFLGSGWWAIRSLQSFYYGQRLEEAALTADGYSKAISLALDAHRLFEEALTGTLETAVAIIDSYPTPLDNETLSSLKDRLHVDVVYHYDPSLTVTSSSDGTYIGWRVPAPHPIRTFAESGASYAVEELREDTESGTPYRYALHRRDDGSIIQVGIKADGTYEAYEDFALQHIIDELSLRNPHISLALVDQANQISAATEGTPIASIFEHLEVAVPTDMKGYRRLKVAQTSYLAFRLPITVNDQDSGSLVVLFDPSKLDYLIKAIAVTITLVLLLFFIFFLHSFWTVHRLNRRILHAANQDELTGLGNLRLFNETIRGMKGTDCALMVINPVNFKQLNMLYGYAHGDAVLIKLATYLAALACGHEGWEAFRLSDDRFLFLLTGALTQGELGEVARSIIADSPALGLVSRPALAIGIAEKRFDEPRETPLLTRALIALNSTGGANPVQFYTIDLESRLIGDNAIEELLKRAIDGEAGIVTLAFQPIVECASGRIVAYEALARLSSLELGTVSPELFIPIAERHQLITGLGTLLFPMALTLLERFKEQGITDVRLAINVSALQLMDDTFVNFVRSYLSTRSIDGRAIVLELTESAFAYEEDGLTQRFMLLRSLGIGLSIDDFGSGYSSLSRLRALPFDILKLGRPFIQEIEQAAHAHFVRDIISMAHHINKRVVAEGVETEAQRTLLSALGCDLLQGYLLGRPLGLEEVLEQHESGGGHA